MKTPIEIAHLAEEKEKEIRRKKKHADNLKKTAVLKRKLALAVLTNKVEQLMIDAKIGKNKLSEYIVFDLPEQRNDLEQNEAQRCSHKAAAGDLEKELVKSGHYGYKVVVSGDVSHKYHDDIAGGFGSDAPDRYWYVEAFKIILKKIKQKELAR